MLLRPLILTAALSTSKSFTLPKASTQTLTRLMSTTPPPPVPYFAVHVSVQTKPGTSSSFLSASLLNARSSSLEPGVLRFDVLQDKEDENNFLLVEVYKDDEQAPKAHKETEHYMAWRETVADMMERPREAKKFKTYFPATEEGWGYGDSKLE
mmetsp:Transcript_11906/g.24356  ORF Transcript_11906/g.24356 Transcript_11906/m.24356 type:complete len:153 (+) Transcript_11906:2-460(+)